MKAEAVGPKWLDGDEIDRVVRAVEARVSIRHLAILPVLRHPGIRVGELTAVKLRDIDLAAPKHTRPEW